MRDLLLACLAFGPGVARADNSYEFGYGGRLTDATGKPLPGPVSLQLTFYHDSNGSQPILKVTDGLQSLPLQQGVFQFAVNLSASDYDSVFTDVAQPVWVRITNLSTPQPSDLPIQQLLMVPYAAKIPVDGKTVSFGSDGKLTVGPSAAPASNQFLTKDSNGRLIWATPSTAATAIQGQTVSSTAPSAGQVLSYSGGQWVPATIVTNNGTVTSMSATALLMESESWIVARISISVPHFRALAAVAFKGRRRSYHCDLY